MAQNIYDQPAFFQGYSGLQRSLHGLAGMPEWPSVRALLPALKGKRVVDLGCGFGWFCRFAAEEGASAVLGIDLSEKMLARARSDNAHPSIEYRLGDLETLILPVGGFDFAYSALAFHYVVDFARLMKVVHGALTPGARFVFLIEHPIYMASRHPAWIIDAQGRKTWPVDRYSVEGERVTDWLAKGVVKQHRTMGTTLNTLIDTGFVIERLIEWSPSPEQIEETPALAEEKERPMFMIVSVHR